MILSYLANLIIALQIVSSSGFPVNSTDFFKNVIQTLDEIKETNAENAVTFKKQLLEQSVSIQKIKSEQERAEETASKQVDKLRTILEKINQSNAENTAEIRKQLSELPTLLKPQEKQEASDEEHLLLKELKDSLPEFLQQNLKLSDAIERIESKLSNIEDTLIKNEMGTSLRAPHTEGTAVAAQWRSGSTGGASTFQSYSHRNRGLNRYRLSSPSLSESSRLDPGQSLLYAIRNGYVEVVLQLLKSDAPVEYEEYNKNRPIHIAVQYRYPQILEILLENQADVESHGEYEMTALHMAGYYNCTECGRILIGKGADVESRDQYGNTPIMLAARSGLDEFVNLLLAYGANANAVNSNGWTALYWASLKGRLSTAALLSSKVGSAWVPASDGTTPFRLPDYA